MKNTNLDQAVKSALADFAKTTSLAGKRVESDVFESEVLMSPHKPPSRLPQGRMAVYAFFNSGECLKVGKVGPNSEARYVSQHSSPNSAGSTLAKSLIKNAHRFSADFDINEIGQWIKANTDRINILLPATEPSSLLSLLEAFLQYRWRPVFEGRN